MAVNLNILQKVHKRLECNHSCLTGGLCFLCGSRLDISGPLLCSVCSLDLPLNNKACPVCANPGEDGIICAICLQSQKQQIKQTYCVYRYEYPISQLIQGMKFNSRLDIVAYFGRQLVNFAIQRNIRLPDCFIPVPLHPSRLRERGFNQSLELARIVANETRVPVDYRICERLLNTATQTGLPAHQRRRNIKGSFKINKNALSRYQHVTIIDDVVTTGSTVHELAYALNKIGIAQIDVWACARASIA